jgi:hypothetical protein
MAYRKRIAAILLSCLILFLPTGCLLQSKPTAEAPPAFSPDLPPAQYQTVIAELEQDTAGQARAPEEGKNHLHLAWLYASCKNPGRNYQKALEHITLYLASDSGSDDLYDANNLKSFLTEIQAAQARNVEVQNQCTADKEKMSAEMGRLEAKSSQMQSKAERLEQENRVLLEANDTLRSNNRELASYNKSLLEKNKQFEETIERLKTLEMQLEQKRKSFK